MQTKVVTNTNPVLPKKTSNQDTKITFLVVITFVLGLLSLVSLVFVLKYSDGGIKLSRGPEDEPTNVALTEDNTPTIIDDDELKRKGLLFELDKLDIENVVNDYSDDVLDEGL